MSITSFVAKYGIYIMLAVGVSPLAGGCGPDITRPLDPQPAKADTKPDSTEPQRPVDRSADGPRVRPVNLNVPAAPTTSETQIGLAVAKNETASFAIQLSQLPKSSGRRAFTLRLTAPTRAGGGAEINPSNIVAYQILSMPIDVNRAGFVRHTGLPGDRRVGKTISLPVIMMQPSI